MRNSVIIVLGASIALSLASPLMAQARAGRPPHASPPATTPRGDQLHTQDRLRDPTRLHDQDKLHDQDRLKDRDKLHDQDKLKDRDRLHDQDGQAIYADNLMTPAERSAYMNRMHSLNTVQERNAFREQHRIEMQQRARERGVTIPPDNGRGTQQQGGENGN